MQNEMYLEKMLGALPDLKGLEVQMNATKNPGLHFTPKEGNKFEGYGCETTRSEVGLQQRSLMAWLR